MFFVGFLGEPPLSVFFFQAEDGIRDGRVTGVQTCALPISAVIAAFGTSAPAGSVTVPRMSPEEPTPCPRAAGLIEKKHSADTETFASKVDFIIPPGPHKTSRISFRVCPSSLCSSKARIRLRQLLARILFYIPGSLSSTRHCGGLRIVFQEPPLDGG